MAPMLATGRVPRRARLGLARPTTNRRPPCRQGVPVPAFADLVSYFLDELFVDPAGRRDRRRGPPLRRPVARHQRGRPAGAAGVRRPLAGRLRRARSGLPVARRAHRPRPGHWASWTPRCSPRPRSARTSGTRCSGSTSWAAACIRCWRASSRRSTSGWRRSSAGSRGSRRSSPMPARPSAATRIARSRSSAPRSPASGSAAWPTSAGRRSRRRRPRRRRTRRSPSCCPGCARRPTRRRRPSRTWAIPARRGGAGGHGRRGDRRGAVRREAAPHDARPGHHARGDPGPRRGGVRGRPRRDGADRARRLAGVVRGPAAARRRGGDWCAGCSTRSRPSTRPPTSWCRTAARSWSGSRRSVASTR